jgi:hypothetical protein
MLPSNDNNNRRSSGTYLLPSNSFSYRKGAASKPVAMAGASNVNEKSMNTAGNQQQQQNKYRATKLVRFPWLRAITIGAVNRNIMIMSSGTVRWSCLEGCRYRVTRTVV